MARLYVAARHETLSKKVESLAKEDRILILCGDYEGVDQRALDICIDEELSIGDYVLTGGELPALVVINTVARYLDGVLGCDESTKEESFSNGLLEYPQYTRPEVYRGRSVPEVLLGGNHKDIAKWREEKSLEITMKNRPDLFKDADLKLYLPKRKKNTVDKTVFEKKIYVSSNSIYRHIETLTFSKLFVRLPKIVNEAI